MSAVDVRLLRSFLAVAEDRNISAAARRLFLSQQTLSGQIQQLERSVGVPLLVRGTRGVTLTAAGERLAAGAAGLTAQLDALVAEVRSTSARRHPGGRPGGAQPTRSVASKESGTVGVR